MKTNTIEKEIREYLLEIGITKNKTKHYYNALILHYNQVKEDSVEKVIQKLKYKNTKDMWWPFHQFNQAFNKEEIESINNIFKAGQRNQKIDELFS